MIPQEFRETGVQILISQLVSFHFSGEALEFSAIFISVYKGEDCIFLKGTSVRLNVIM